jgi:hypothetical protein
VPGPPPAPGHILTVTPAKNNASAIHVNSSRSAYRWPTSAPVSPAAITTPPVWVTSWPSGETFAGIGDCSAGYGSATSPLDARARSPSAVTANRYTPSGSADTSAR